MGSTGASTPTNACRVASSSLDPSLRSIVLTSATGRRKVEVTEWGEKGPCLSNERSRIAGIQGIMELVSPPTVKIERNPKRCGGDLVLAGTRMGVHDIVTYWRLYNGDVQRVVDDF